MLLQDYLICSIFMKFVFEQPNMLRRTTIMALTIYFIYLVRLNYVQKYEDIMIPLYYPVLILKLLIIVIGMYEVWVLRPIIRSGSLAKSIKIELKNRYSFVILIMFCSMVSQTLLLFPSLFG